MVGLAVCTSVLVTLRVTCMPHCSMYVCKHPSIEMDIGGGVVIPSDFKHTASFDLTVLHYAGIQHSVTTYT